VAVLGLLPSAYVLARGGGDWSVFWSAGATVGSSNLANAANHTAWQAAHGVTEQFWYYPPAFAYAFAPFTGLPLWLGYIVHAVLMLGLVATAGLLAARSFRISDQAGLLLALAWTPATASINMGNPAPLATVLTLWMIYALSRDREFEAGLALGLLIYKPTLGLPLLAFFVLRRRWRVVAVGSAAVAAWYLLSVAATAGDWAWPVNWWNDSPPWLAADLAANAQKAISLPGLLVRLPGFPTWLAYLAGAALGVAALRGLIRAPLLEATAAACLLTLADGPRIWVYEAGLLLPIFAWAAGGGLPEPWRTRLIVIGVPLGLLWFLSAATVVSGVAVIVSIALGLWLWRWAPWPRSYRLVRGPLQGE
jgi:hypothetical protein